MKTKILIILIILIGLTLVSFDFGKNDVFAQVVPTLFKFTKPLYRGTKNNEVYQLQTFLKQFPEIYPEGLVTGYFGPLTEAAVKKLQEKHGIEPIGIVGPKTRAKINEIFSSQPPSTSQPTKPILTCADGSPNNTCASVEPFMCKDGQLVARSDVCGCGNGQPLQNGECSSKCQPIQYSGDPATKLDIVFVPDKLESGQMPFFVVVAVPNLAGLTGEYGILKREPFASSKQKINIWALAITEDFTCEWPVCHTEPGVNWTEEQRQGHEKLMAALATCPGKDEVVIMRTQSKSAWAGDAVAGSGYAFVDYSPGGLDSMAALVTHEFAHALGGITDDYNLGLGSYLHESNLTGVLNCDRAGCPKWCSGQPAMSYSEYAPECTTLVTQTVCESGPDCVWFPKLVPNYPQGTDSSNGPVDPYYGSSCIARERDKDNGLNCLPNTGCFQGCGGGIVNWWRSATKSIMTDDLYLNFSGWHIKLLQDQLSKYR